MFSAGLFVCASLRLFVFFVTKLVDTIFLKQMHQFLMRIGISGLRSQLWRSGGQTSSLQEAKAAVCRST